MATRRPSTTKRCSTTSRGSRLGAAPPPPACWASMLASLYHRAVRSARSRRRRAWARRPAPRREPILVAKSIRTTYACTECGAASPRWVGRCPGCGSWNSLVEEVVARSGPPRAAGPVAPAVSIVEVAPQVGAHRPAGVAEHGRVLYVCAEESREQVRLRAERLGALHPDLYLAAETDLGAIRTLVAQVGPRVVVVDSVQTVADPELAGAPGGVGQVREVAAQLVRLAKERGVATFLVGQVTKDGAVAGPKTLEHLVDVVLSFEGDQHHALRLVRCTKNRYGPAY